MAIVGDDHQPTAKFDELTLEPLDGIDIEMISGLVENQQVGIGDQRRGQRDPLLLAPGQPGDIGVQQVTQPESIEHRLAPPALTDCLPHGSGRQIGDLRDGGDGDIAPASHLSYLGFDRSGQYGQQRRLAGPVDSDHAPSIAGGHGHRHVREQRPTGTAHSYRVDVDENHTTHVTVRSHPWSTR